MNSEKACDEYGKEIPEGEMIEALEGKTIVCKEWREVQSRGSSLLERWVCPGWSMLGQRTKGT